MHYGVPSQIGTEEKMVNPKGRDVDDIGMVEVLHENAATDMDCRRVYSSQCSFSLALPPNDRPGVDLWTGCL